MIPTPNSVSKKTLSQSTRKEGMLTLFEDGMTKAANGLTTEEEVRRVAL